jgi:beta-galactosidase
MYDEELAMIPIRVIIPVSFCLLASLVFAAPVPVKVTGERRVGFNEGWMFFKGDAPGAEQPGFDDSAWRLQRLPHDWAIEGAFDRKVSPHMGALVSFGAGWYRKTFTLPESAKDRHFSIEFDGAMSNAHVWLNGQDLGGRPYGYSGFGFDLTPHLHFGAQPNVLAVRLMPEDHSSRWYPGAGIYRNVWLDVTGSLHVARWGTYLTTPEVADNQASVVVKTEVRNDGASAQNFALQTTILDAAGRSVARTSGPASIGPGLLPGASQTITDTLLVIQPVRWDIDHPTLYTLVSEVLDGRKVVDRYATTFGIRTIAYDKQKGFLLNGRAVKLHGVCDHHDLGALGTAVSRRATERQLEILKAAGVNAIRTSHNPPSPELLEYCDRMGLLVMDEVFDMWQTPKVPNGLSKFFDEWSERDVRDFVHRDRNHPSIIMWSIGNEVMEQREANGWQQAKRLTAFFHEEDPTRPTTAAFNSWAEAIKNKLADEVDVPGFNYQPMHYEQIMKEHPNWIILGSETASCVSSRGVYHLPLERYVKHPSLQISSFDIISPQWAYCPDVEFTYQDRLPNVLGEFVWTGFDYIGEPTPFFDYHPGADNSKDWPAHSSYFGFIDLAGFPKDRYYLYQSEWTSKPMVHLLPHWNWAGHEGEVIPVMAYSNAADVELFLNGKSLGKKQRFAETWDMPVGQNVSLSGKFATKYRRIWQVPYAAGTLRAVAYQDGKQVAVAEVRTAGPAAKIALAPDHSTINADGDDLSFVTVRIEDKDGNLVPGADNLVKFAVTGGAIAGVDNGNPAGLEPFQADHRKAFSGMALLIVRSQAGAPGKIKVVATSDGLTQASTEIVTRRAP